MGKFKTTRNSLWEYRLSGWIVSSLFASSLATEGRGILLLHTFLPQHSCFLCVKQCCYANHRGCIISFCVIVTRLKARLWYYCDGNCVFSGFQWQNFTVKVRCGSNVFWLTCNLFFLVWLFGRVVIQFSQYNARKILCVYCIFTAWNGTFSQFFLMTFSKVNCCLACSTKGLLLTVCLSVSLSPLSLVSPFLSHSLSFLSCSPISLSFPLLSLLSPSL